MRGYFRLSLPAAGSLAVNGLLLLMLFQLGIGQQRARKEAPALTVLSLAVPLGGEDAQDEEQAEQQQPAQPAAPAPPPVPLPKTDSAVPAPPLPPVTLPVAQPHATAPPAEPASAAAPSTTAVSAAPPPRKGAADGLNANAPAGTSRSYAAKIRSWLYAHKTYPRRSRMRREEGVVRVRFVLDRRGQLLEGEVIGRSGFAALDEEGEAMLSRASPYPAAPQDLPGNRIEFTVPIEWQLPA